MGGGVQVADSVIRELYKFPQHSFVVVCSSVLYHIAEEVHSANVKFVEYDMPFSLQSVLFGRENFLDKLVEEEKIEVVLTVFGPSRWRPKVRHLSGFARSHLLLPESPYWQMPAGKRNWKQKIKMAIMRRQFGKDADEYYTENAFISERLSQLYPKKRVYTVTNTYNQVFDEPGRWIDEIQLDNNDAFKLLTIASYYPHKNIDIVPEVIDVLNEKHPSFHFQFVVTVDEKKFWAQNEYSEQRAASLKFIGKISIEQCPSLYKQCDAMFLPTLLECFSASYAEAMRMECPILTSDLGFAHSICKDAACYFNPTSAEDIADNIYKLAADKGLQQSLVAKGKELLPDFDNAEQRVQKLIKILSE
ncbi:MAG: glycosyltransferase [Lachnospiraceae bacterium]|nr:glycosyltransferase [Lachnospiraceae bacterium]